MEIFQNALKVHIIGCLLVLSGGPVTVFVGGIDYQDALTKSIIFLEAQRSGKLPPDNRLPWRGNSALEDGKLENVRLSPPFNTIIYDGHDLSPTGEWAILPTWVDLVGGYYDAGDNVKYGLPMAFTITTLSWAADFYRLELQGAGEMENVRDAIRWGTDYLLKASSRRNRLYVEVGDPKKDHECWISPEYMRTPRTVLKIDQNSPGTEIACETCAALAAASIVFKSLDRAYSRRLVNRAKALFEFAKNYKGTYDGECPFYCSYSGYQDELLWAATWLYKATRRSIYLDYIKEEAFSASVSEFSWDLKYAGSQIILSELHWQGHVELQHLKQHADSFVCSVLPDSPDHQVFITPGGLVHLRDGANMQYVTGTAFLFSVYSDLLAKHKQEVICGDKKFDSTHLMAFAKKQMDYVLGENPLGRSYMVGFGNKPPTQAHHRGASVPATTTVKSVDCPMSFVYWYNKDQPNPNELTGAIVGGPDRSDNFEDKRSNSAMTEPTTYTNSLAVGILAKLAKHNAQS